MTFAFKSNVPVEHRKIQGDWSSNAYLVYLELSPAQKQRAVNAMATMAVVLELSLIFVFIFSHMLVTFKFFPLLIIFPFTSNFSSFGFGAGVILSSALLSRCV